MDTSKDKEVIHIPEGTSEITIRRGDAPEILTPNPVDFIGHISAPGIFYQKRKAAKADYFDAAEALVVVDYEEKIITLRHEARHQHTDQIQGRIFGSERVKEFKINQKNAWRPKELAEFIRRNRLHFPDKDLAVKIVQELQYLKLKTNGEIDISDDNRGNTTNLFTQKTITTIPVSFELFMPIIAGGEKKKFAVDIYFHIEGGSISLSLESVEMIDMLENDVREAMDAEVKIFEGSGIPVLYK